MVYEIHFWLIGGEEGLTWTTAAFESDSAFLQADKPGRVRVVWWCFEKKA